MFVFLRLCRIEFRNSKNTLVFKFDLVGLLENQNVTISRIILNTNLKINSTEKGIFTKHYYFSNFLSFVSDNSK